MVMVRYPRLKPSKVFADPELLDCFGSIRHRRAQMNLDLVAGTPLWDWYYSGASFAGFIVTVLINAMVLGLSNWRAGGIFFKTVLFGAAVAAMPLGLASIGLNMAISNPELVSIASVAGVSVSVVLGVPYLLVRALSRSGGKQQGQPEDVKKAASGVEKQRTQVFNIPGKPSGTVNYVAPGKDSAENQTVYGELEFRSGPRNGETMEIRPGTLTLGRSPDNDIVINDPSVSRKHARLTSQGGRYYIEDLGSMNGTKMNGESVKREQVDTGTSLMLGGVEVVVGKKETPVQEPKNIRIDGPVESTNDTVVRQPVINAGWLAFNPVSVTGDLYALKPGTNVIGRDKGCDLSVNDPYMSRKHALISVKEGKSSIADLGSLGGVKVNGQPVAGTSVAPGTEVAVGDTVLRLVEIQSPDNLVGPQDPSGTLLDKGPEKAVVAMVVSGQDAGKSFKLKEGANLIGRTGDCAVQLTDSTISRQHAQVVCFDGKLSVSDLGSRAGTKAGGANVTGTSISNGDVVSIGRTGFTLMGAAA
jgi:pSer/pThr/pTyr-binding forkhead associated (FHA) protein